MLKYIGTITRIPVKGNGGERGVKPFHEQKRSLSDLENQRNVFKGCCCWYWRNSDEIISLIDAQTVRFRCVMEITKHQVHDSKKSLFH